MTNFFRYFLSPVGKLLISSKNNALVGLWIEGQKKYPTIQTNWIERQNQPVLIKVVQVLQSYFQGKGLPEVFNFQINLEGTPFQKQVWQEIQNVKYGQTSTYKELAQKIGNPRAVRAVGSAVGSNPVCILVGCHRIKNLNGGLGGYAGGIDNKKKLLKYENIK